MQHKKLKIYTRMIVFNKHKKYVVVIILLQGMIIIKE
jgi:hypothetical protein